jgi:DNA-nicking Smr family endonuclease
MSRSNRKEPSDSEAAFFREALKDVKPLGAKPVHRSRPKTETRIIATPPPKPPVYTEAEATNIGGHREAHMRRGRLEPDAKLDLHGYKQEPAFLALHRFITRARALDHRVILVVTGKGGVLHDMLPRWLGDGEFRDMVVGVTPAHARHGGDGAFYVALKKQKKR